MESKLKQNSKSKRLRVSEAYKWGDGNVVELLNLIADVVKDAPKSFEKPTAQMFYLKIMSRSSTFEGLNFLVLKNKMRYLKSSYISAMEWKKTTGADLLADGYEQQVTENVLKICPRFELLHKIYGSVINMNVAVIKSEPSFDDTKRSSSNQSEANGLTVIGEDENTCGNTSTPVTLLSQRSRLITTGEDENTTATLHTQRSRSNTISRRSRSTESDVSSSKIAFQEQNIYIEEKKLKFQAENAELERAHALRLKEMELRAHKELEVIKLEMTLQNELEIKLKEFELKKYALDLKYKVQNM